MKTLLNSLKQIGKTLVGLVIVVLAAFALASGGFTLTTIVASLSQIGQFIFGGMVLLLVANFIGELIFG